MSIALPFGLPQSSTTVLLSHGGSVRASSAGRGQGSEFVIRLPLAEHREPDPTGPGTHEGPGTLGHVQILVVDDNRDAADSLAALLAALGAEVEVAYGGAQALEALERLERRAPVAVLLDRHARHGRPRGGCARAPAAAPPADGRARALLRRGPPLPCRRTRGPARRRRAGRRRARRRCEAEARAENRRPQHPARWRAAAGAALHGGGGARPVAVRPETVGFKPVYDSVQTR